MVDITHKQKSLRIATAQATVKVSREATIEAIHQGTVPKGNVLEIARAAGLFAVKKTPDMIPDCHPLPIEGTHIEYTIEKDRIYIALTAKTIYRTGVEVEAMHAASVVALTIYDMLKPIDKGVEIENIRLLSKSGGKSAYKHDFDRTLKAAVVVCSDAVASGKKEDTAGQEVCEQLKSHDIDIQEYTIISDDADQLRKAAEQLLSQSYDIILFTGGTGLSARDITPDVIAPYIKMRVPGIEEAMRSFGQERTPYSMFSRGVAGISDTSLIITLPGSTNGAKESMQAIMPGVLHIFRIFERSKRHQKS